MNRKRWQLCPQLPDEVLEQRLGGKFLPPALSPLLVQLLHNRGIEDPAEFEPFLTADERLTHDSRLLQDIDKAVTRLLRALLGDELIAIYGDFDADGITATVLMVEAVSRMGGRAVYYIPHRVGEGHGLNQSALKSLKEQGVSLVVTVDCGISETSEVEQGQKLGLDIIITDHHVAPELPPPAVAAINPKRPDSKYPFFELAGVGVAFKLIQALWGATHRDGEEDDFLDLVALGTIADMSPLQGENRYLVKRGLEVLNQTQRVGLQELITCAGLEMGRLDEDNVSYALGPRLNASGRMEHAVTSYELLTASSRDQARRLAAALEANNSERQRLTSEFLDRAKDELLAKGIELPVLMVGGPDYPAGITGIVAGKLADEFYRPAIVLQLGEETVRGSARSIPEFDIVAALAECQDLLTRFGGHRQAAGFLVPSANLEQLNRMLLEIAYRELEGVDLRPMITIDAEVPFSTLSGETYKLIGKLAPFGQANQVPTFLSRNVKVVEARRVGEEGSHLKLKLRDGRAIWDAIAFNLGDRETSLYLDIVYNLQKEYWGGKQLLRLNIIDFVTSS
ncbi:MAG TPA: single-stranded-DNA-specific exonuclease RecJ [Dehalococcoidia bacterium]|nr:single-stranded-DNA-specific exonuclease RecJ [Dehalococcoidia bacterium]